MSEWRRGTIGEFAKGYRGVSYAAGQLRQFKSPDTVTLLRSNNIYGGRLNFDDVQLVPLRLVSDEQLLRTGDIAVCMSNGSKALVGKAAPFLDSMDEQFTVGAFCSLFRPNEASFPAFASYIFQSKEYRKNLDLALAGTAINNLRNVDIERFGCDIPPLAEQAKIARVLDILDTAIHETEAIIAKLKAVKQGLVHDLLTRGIDANGELRPPRTEAPHLYKNSQLGWIPNTWELRGVLDVAPYDRQCILTGPFGADLGQADFRPDGVPVLRIGNVQAGFIDWSNTQYVTQQKANFLAKYRVQEGDLLFARQGATTGRNALADARAEGALINYHIIRVAVDIAKCHPTYLYAVFNSDTAKSQVDQAKGRGTREGINSAQIASLLFALPNPEEQGESVRRMASIDESILGESMALEKLLLQKVGLMDDLLTGRVRVMPLLAADQQESA